MDDNRNVCPRCNGSGSIEVPAHGSWEEWGTIYAECSRCHGLGWETKKVVGHKIVEANV